MRPLRVPGTLDSLAEIGQYVMDAAASAGLDKRAAYRLRLAVDEIATNIIMHGYQEAGMSGDIDLRADVSGSTLKVSIEDTAREFDPRQHGRPDHLDAPAHERPIGGLGVYLAMESVDEFQYERVGGKNRNVFIVNRHTPVTAE